MGAVNLVVLACILRERLKKGRQLFRGKEKSAPQKKNPGYAYDFRVLSKVQC